MTYKESADHFDGFIAHITNTFMAKGAEYKTEEEGENDRFAYFRLMQQALQHKGIELDITHIMEVLKTKQEICLHEMSEDISYPMHYLREKCGDVVIYTILQYMYRLQRNEEMGDF